MFKKDVRIGFKKDFRRNKSSYLFGIPFLSFLFVTSTIGMAYLIKWFLMLVTIVHAYVIAL